MKNSVKSIISRIKRITSLKYLIIFIILLSFSLNGLINIPLHGDESTWIFTSKNFESFIHFDFDDAIWQESFWTLTQPPVAAYIIGFGRTIGGYGADNVNQPYDFFLSKEENIERGAIPEDNLLFWSRVPMAILASFSFLVIIILMEYGFGTLAGFITFGFILGNAFFFYCLRLALGESSLFFFFNLATLFACLAFSAWEKKDFLLKTKIIKISLYFVLMSVFIGLSTASKINGGFAVLAGIILSIYIGFSTSNKKAKQWFISGMPITIGTVSFLAFFLVNPFLYPQPLTNSLKLFLFRTHEMGLQQNFFPEYQISGLYEHAYTDFIRIFQDYATISFPGSYIINFSLFIVGIIVVWHIWKKQKSISPIGAVLLLFYITLSIPSLFTPLDYPRYFLFPVVFSQIIIIIASTAIIKLLFTLIKSKFNNKSTQI